MRSIRHLRRFKLIIQNLDAVVSVGYLAHELKQSQRIRINMECQYMTEVPTNTATLDQVICYAQLVDSIRSCLVAHTYWLETLAEHLAAIPFNDTRCDTVMVRIQKLDAIDGLESVGVEIQRTRSDMES